MAVKSRIASGIHLTAYQDGAIIGTGTFGSSTESIETFSHDLSLLGSGLDVGGPMLLTRMRDTLSPSVSIAGWSRGSQFLPGNIIGIDPLVNPVVPSNAVLYPQGATAISRSIPSTPVAQGLTFLTEAVKDGLPSLPGVQTWRDRTKNAKNAGDEYLNVEFGWLPLVSDMRNFAKAVKDHSKILNDYKAGSGKVTRVGYSFPSSTKSVAGTGNCFQSMPGAASNYSYVSPANYFAYQETKTWFKGAFSYHLPASDSQIGKAQLYAAYADKLLGIKPTPAAIWNASPWTWALDWFGNAGDVLANISALGQNGMVLNYGYLMTSSITRQTMTYAAHSDGFYTSAGTREVITEYKKRIGANPYGFGVSDSDLTAAQKAVIVALGLTHVGGH